MPLTDRHRPEWGGHGVRGTVTGHAEGACGLQTVLVYFGVICRGVAGTDVLPPHDLDARNARLER